MGSFAITYDDFSGGHYMGNKAAAVPKNTWYGTNAVLNPQGELIPGATGLMHQFSSPLVSTLRQNIYYGWQNLYNSSFVVTFEGTGGPVSQVLTVNSNSVGAVTSTTQTTLTGWVVGSCSVTENNSGAFVLFYVDANTGNVRQFNTSSLADTVVSTALAGLVTAVVPYKYRLVAWRKNSSQGTLYYSDATKSTFSTSDYYDFNGAIEAVIPRANDLIVVTSNGIYSMTGVLGTSVNIQLIAPTNELMPGMIGAKASGRSIYFANEGNAGHTPDNRIYEFLGATTREVVRIGVDDTVAGQFDRLALNVLEGGNLAVAVSNGAFYVMRPDGTFVRMFVNRDAGSSSESYIAEPNHQFLGYTGDAVLAVDGQSATIDIYRIIHSNPYPNRQIGATTPAEATVLLPEYWHQKPMTVRELLVEAVYDYYHPIPFYLTGNASVAARIKTTGVVDHPVAGAQNLYSSQQVYTTDLVAEVTGNNAAVLHRFRVDNGQKAYGARPEIVFAGCRIRRVIAVCED